MRPENISISIKTGNDAFQDGMSGHEVARILRQLADAFERDGMPRGPLYDANGNRCGEIRVRTEDE